MISPLSDPKMKMAEVNRPGTEAERERVLSGTELHDCGSRLAASAWAIAVCSVETLAVFETF
jgi:hypothetical protein